MQAVILAAGVGSRLNGASDGMPKCLLPIGDRPLIEHQLEALADAGIAPVLILVGHKQEEIRQVVGNQAEYIENPRYQETNSLYSLWLARKWVKGEFLLLNGDLLFHPMILDRLLSKGGTSLAFDASSASGQEKTKVFVRDGRVWDLGKDVAPELARGESLGMICFDAAASEDLFSRVEAMVANGGEKSWVMEAVRSMCATVDIRAVNVAGKPWAELDFPYDLDRARRQVWPAIKRDRWKRTLNWRVMRWVAASFAALALFYSGFFVSANLHPPVEFATIAPLRSTEVLLPFPNGTQKWWLATREQPLRANLRGPSSIMVDFRLLIRRGAKVPGRYVVQIAIDGEPVGWEVFKATEDPKTTLPDFIVGDRDRFEFKCPKGTHVIEVALIAGTSDSMLVRVRNQEPASPEDEESE